MSGFVDRWHVGLAVSGLAVGLVAMLLTSFGPVRRLEPTPLVVLVAVVTMTLTSNLDHGLWWALGCGLAVVATRSYDSTAMKTDRWMIGMFLFATLGLWATVPDTEGPLLLGVVIAPTLVRSLVLRRSFGRAQVGVGLIGLAAAGYDGAAGTRAGLLGAVCCVTWVVVAVVLAPFLSGAIRVGPSLVIGSIGHAVALVLGSRVVGHADAAVGWATTVAVVLGSVVAALGLHRGLDGDGRGTPSAGASGRSHDE